MSPQNTLLGSTLIFLCPLLFVLSSKPSASITSEDFFDTLEPVSGLPSLDLFFEKRDFEVLDVTQTSGNLLSYKINL